jgi:hypothetical protein
VSRTVTLEQLRADVRDQADIAGATTRHAATLLNRYINQSVQRFRERVSGEGVQHFLTSATGSLGTGATSPYSFYALDLSALAIVRTYAVDVTINGVTKTLVHVPFASRNEFGGPTAMSEPVAWANYQTAKVAIFPAPNQAYTYVAWYLPVLPDLTQNTETFDGVAGWEDYVTWDVVSKVIVRDKYPQAFAMAEKLKAEVWADILRNATRVSHAGGAVVGRDSFGEKLNWGGTRLRILPRP